MNENPKTNYYVRIFEPCVMNDELLEDNKEWNFVKKKKNRSK